MKVLIVSDTHKAHGNLFKVIEDEKPFDMLIHLGDGEGVEFDLEHLLSCPIHIVGGNNDFFSNLPREKEFFIDGHHVFITHGHAYYVSRSEERLIEEGKGRGADIVMYGHTHKPSVHQEKNFTVLNPGSLSYPRQTNRKASYIIMEIDEEGIATYEIKYV
ncbi:MAG: metallophosphoesterase family protein [Suipraeoptans sp.]